MKTLPAALVLALVFPAAALAAEDDALQQLNPPGAVVPSAPLPGWAQYQNPYSGEQNDIANPNRTGEEISAWGSRAVADVLTYKPGGFKEQIRVAQKYFVQTGWADFAAYLKNSELLSVLQAGRHAVSAVASRDPMIIDSAVQDGAWHWTLSVPVIISVSSPDLQGVLQPVSTHKTAITLSVARVAEGGEDGLAIASWSAKDE